MLEEEEAGLLPHFFWLARLLGRGESLAWPCRRRHLTPQHSPSPSLRNRAIGLSPPSRLFNWLQKQQVFSSPSPPPLSFPPKSLSYSGLTSRDLPFFTPLPSSPTSKTMARKIFSNALYIQILSPPPHLLCLSPAWDTTMGGGG